MYQYHNDILSIPAKLLYKELAIISYNYYKSLCTRKKLIRTRCGLGKGNEALISFYDIADDWIKNAVVAFLGDPKNVVKRNELEELIKPDTKAANYFASHLKPNGKHLSFSKQIEKTTSAMIFNAIDKLLKERGARLKNKTKAWINISEAINDLATKKRSDGTRKWKFNLPENPKSLQRKFRKYLNDGYSCFIHGLEGKGNAKKMTADIERLIISLYCLPNKPFMNKVHDMYLQFLGGAIDVFDIKTGEVFNREDFYVNGKPVDISVKTIWNCLKAIKNDNVIKRARNGFYDFSHKSRPHVDRYAPTFSMSKISLDDRDIGHTKMPNGKTVKAYYAFDDLSGAMIGISHSKKKDHNLYLDCLKNMFRFLSHNKIGIPMEMEVEHHLVRDFREGLMKAGEVFPFVRWCRPTNSQEKYAERQIGIKKYGVEKDNNQNVGRHYAKRDSNRITNQKIFDEQNNNYKNPTASYSEIVLQDLKEMEDYNNSPHSDQEKFEGMTKLEVLLLNLNPDLPPLDKSLLAKYIGYKEPLKIMRNQYVQLGKKNWQLDGTYALDLLAPNNYRVDAYYIPNKNGDIEEVFIYQNGQFICECHHKPSFNRAKAEWKEKDEKSFKKGMEYITSFDAKVKRETAEKLQKISILKKPKDEIIVDAEIVQDIPEQQNNYYSPPTSKDVKNQAINDI